MSRAAPAWFARPALTWILAGLGYVLCAGLVHWPVTGGGFQFDDFQWLHLRHWEGVLFSFVGNWRHGVAYRPIMRLSYFLDLGLFGENPLGWHVENVLLHALNALLLAALLRKLGASRGFAGAAGLLFTVMPFATENVDWISGRTGVLCLGFLLIAGRFWLGALTGGRRSLGWALLAALLAQMTYEAAIIAPAWFALLGAAAILRLGVKWQLCVAPLRMSVYATLAFWLLRFFFVGTASAQVDDLHPDIITALARNLPAIAAFFGRFWGAVGLSVLGAAVLASCWARRTRQEALLLLLAALMLYAPYVMVAELHARFLYMAEAPLAALLLLPASLPAAARFRLAAGAAILLLVLPGFGLKSNEQARAFSAAGARALEMLASMRAIEVPEGSLAIVDGVPSFVDGQPAIGWYFETAVSDRFGLPFYSVQRSETVLADPDRRQQLQGETVRFYRYDPASNQVTPESRAEWEAAHPE